MDSQKAQLVGPYFLRKLAKLVASDPQAELDARAAALAALMRRFFLLATEDSGLHFYTLFSRIAYAFQLSSPPEAVQYAVHRLRGRVERHERRQYNWSETDWAEGVRALAEAIAHMTGHALPAALAQHLPPLPQVAPRPADQLLEWARLLITGSEGELLCGLSEEGARVRVGPRMRFESYYEAARQAILQTFRFPVIVHLLEVVVEGDLWRPRLIVLEPDFLIDVTAIAECVHPDGMMPQLHLLKRFLPWSSSPALVLGNLANYMLDELVVDEQLEWNRDFMRSFFLLSPFAFAKMDDAQLRTLLQHAKTHFANLRKLVKELPESEHRIEPTQAFIEPTFYSHIFGLQGRLDLLYRSDSADGSAIVELKSGRLFRPNAYGLNSNHFIQTLLYDLLVKSALGRHSNPRNYILYSGLDEQPLRYAPPIEANQYDALQLRNRLICQERMLSMALPHQRPRDFERLWRLLLHLHPDNFPKAGGFQRRDLQRFAMALGQLDPPEQRWFAAFVSFVAREHRYAKMGADATDRRGGQASLWLATLEEKKARFEVLNDLKIVGNEAHKSEPLITFEATESTVELSNFRRGDIAVLYPVQEGKDHPLSNQLFKCTILDPGPHRVRVRLRARQTNRRFFEQFERWNLEADVLDSSFLSLYRSLFAFAEAEKDKRKLWLGRRPPARGEALAVTSVPPGLTDEQREVFRRGLQAPEVFLLWGPPGTGKTSKMLHSWVAWLLRHTDEHFMLLAYTNRAVDEICATLHQIASEWLPPHTPIEACYLRLGARYATDRRFHGQLLSEQLKAVDSRAQLVDLLQERRIVVGTVSTVMNRPELFELKRFQRVIIDEASQLTEPMLMGLLPRFDRVMLIGDHKQLPAVVAQPPRLTDVRDVHLRKLGLRALGNSLFERLFFLYEEKQWHHALGRLTHQGRMHADLMAFANEAFYDGALQLLPRHMQGFQRQTAPLQRPGAGSGKPLVEVLARHRMIFLPTPPEDDRHSKQNQAEAQVVVAILRAFVEMYGHLENMPDIGIITPYRAQIAAIGKALAQAGLDPSHWTIDTVERYQGGARDVIILSLCTNSFEQLRTTMNLSEEGVDRKLNVAVTRAREQMIVLGAEEILAQQPLYARLLQRCYRLELASLEG